MSLSYITVTASISIGNLQDLVIIPSTHPIIQDTHIYSPLFIKLKL